MGRRELDAAGLASVVHQTCPRAAHLMTLLGEPFDQQAAAAVLSTYGEDWAGDLTDAEAVARQFSALWRKIQSRRFWELWEILLAEHWISEMPAKVSQHIAPYRFDKTLHTVRGVISLELYSRAKSLNWREPLTFNRALRLCEVYLNGVVENPLLSQPTAIKEYEGRLGVAMVLQARYSSPGTQRSHKMIAHLEASIEAGNDTDNAKTYLAEAFLRRHDSDNDPQSLWRLWKLEMPSTDTCRSLLAEAWMRLAVHATSSAGRAKALHSAADELAAISSSRDPLIRGRVAILSGILEIMLRAGADGGSDLQLRGFRNPFGLKQQVEIWRRQDIVATRLVLKEIISEIDQISGTLAVEPIIRRLRATAHSSRAAVLPERSKEQRLSHLRAAIDARSGGIARRELTDPESSLENVLDLFQQFHESSSTHALAVAVGSAIQLIDEDPTWATPLVVLARELDSLDSSGMPPRVVGRLRQMNPRGSMGIVDDVAHLRVDRVFEEAARRALSSREVDRRSLGGRNAVYMAEDYSGIVAETFIFKATTRQLADREMERAGRIRALLNERRLTRQYAVADTLAETPVPAGDSLSLEGYDVIVARQFHAGDLLSEALEAQGGDHAERLLTRTARFLALIHACEASIGSPGERMRQELRKKEIGWWLRTGLRAPDAPQLFEAWWALFGDLVVPVPRRDAHAKNWIVTQQGQVVALDFEACGWRPAGYEVAQMIDDQPVLDVDSDSWDLRLRVVEAYHHELRQNGLAVDPRAVTAGFEAGLLARAVRHLTMPAGQRRQRSHGERLLQLLRDNSDSQDVVELAARLQAAWRVRIGSAVDLAEGTSAITEARRRHLSRAMAYELRHGTSVLLDHGGWAYIAAVADALNRSGLRTNKRELVAVARALDEPRFDTAGSKMRARYGHTRLVDIDYAPADRLPRLYHGTPFTALNSIFEQDQGLRPMERHWVHLSSDPIAALRTARRHGPGVLLEIQPDQLDEPVLAAGGPVFLARSVPSRALRIVTPAELQGGEALE